MKCNPLLKSILHNAFSNPDIVEVIININKIHDSRSPMVMCRTYETYYMLDNLSWLETFYLKRINKGIMIFSRSEYIKYVS